MGKFEEVAVCVRLQDLWDQWKPLGSGGWLPGRSGQLWVDRSAVSGCGEIRLDFLKVYLAVYSITYRRRG